MVVASFGEKKYMFLNPWIISISAINITLWAHYASMEWGWADSRKVTNIHRMRSLATIYYNGCLWWWLLWRIKIGHKVLTLNSYYRMSVHIYLPQSFLLLTFHLAFAISLIIQTLFTIMNQWNSSLAVSPLHWSKERGQQVMLHKLLPVASLL